MRSAVLIRTQTGDQGTFGEMTLDDGGIFVTGELPWRDNIVGRSCIPAGEYLCAWGASPKHGMCYHLQAVPGRTDVQIHAANWMGDDGMGYKCELLGCIALGLNLGVLDGQKAILSSKAALAAFLARIGLGQFTLKVEWKTGLEPRQA